MNSSREAAGRRRSHPRQRRATGAPLSAHRGAAGAATQEGGGVGCPSPLGEGRAERGNHRECADPARPGPNAAAAAAVAAPYPRKKGRNRPHQPKGGPRAPRAGGRAPDSRSSRPYQRERRSTLGRRRHHPFDFSSAAQLSSSVIEVPRSPERHLQEGCSPPPGRHNGNGGARAMRPGGAAACGRPVAKARPRCYVLSPRLSCDTLAAVP